MLRRATTITSRLGLTVLAVALGIVVIGIALAVVNISFTGTVASNEFATTTTTVPPTTTTTLPPGDGLEAAISTSGGGPSPCSDAIAAGSLSLGDANIDLNNPSLQASGTLTLCVTNALQGFANEITTLTVQATVESSTEIGCSDDEKTTDPEGPADCGVSGELGSVIEVVLTPFNLDDPGCISGQQTVIPGGSSVSLLTPSGALSFGAFCSWDVAYRLGSGATYDQKLAASTDGISLMLDVSGSGT